MTERQRLLLGLWLRRLWVWFLWYLVIATACIALLSALTGPDGP